MSENELFLYVFYDEEDNYVIADETEQAARDSLKDFGVDEAELWGVYEITKGDIIRI